MLKLLNNLSKKNILLIIICLVFITLQVFLDLKIPDFMANITIMLQKTDSTTKDIVSSGILMIMCAIGSLLSSFIVGYCASIIGSSFGKNLRQKVFSKIISFNTKEIKKFSISSLITRNTNDITQVQTFITMSLQLLIKAPIMAIWAISKIANKAFAFSIITFISVLIVLITIIILIIIVMPKFKRIQTLTDNLNRVTRENLTGIKVIRAFNAEEYQFKRFDNTNRDLTKLHMFTQKSMAILNPMLSFIMSSLSLSIYWIGVSLINNTSAITNRMIIFGDMVVFSSYAVQVIISFMMIAILFVIYPRASVSSKRIREVLDTDSIILDGTISKDLNNIHGKIVFENVSFIYPGAKDYVLKNINLTINPGETVAFIGSTGCGKSSLINLIPRFYDPSEGIITINDINIKEMKLSYLYNKIGYIPQKAILFKNSIKNNISFGTINNKKANKDNIISALEVAQAYDFVSKLPKGINNSVAQNGTNLSGGQKQRLSIARAIARKPEIYIFDDTFSALDYKTDYKLRKDLKKYTKNSTILIVAQRIGTIKDADKIVVLDNGKCVGIGTHEQLLKDCKTYQEIAYSQLNKGELKNA